MIPSGLSTKNAFYQFLWWVINTTTQLVEIASKCASNQTRVLKLKLDGRLSLARVILFHMPSVVDSSQDLLRRSSDPFQTDQEI
jgi:hypothetical protein